MKKIYACLLLPVLFYTNAFSQVTPVATWINGDTIPNQFGIYGTKGIPDVLNKPGGRVGAVSWKDGYGNLWLFGGDGHGRQGSNTGYLNDLWCYNPRTDRWTWVSGDDIPYQLADYTPGFEKPGALNNATQWVDDSGNFWLFGGGNNLNDLWRFAPGFSSANITGTWTWVGGDKRPHSLGIYYNLSNTNPPDPPLWPAGRKYATGWTDNSGNFWLFGGAFTITIGFSSWGHDLNDLWKYNIGTGRWVWVSGSSSSRTGNEKASGVYGQKGVPDTANIISMRHGAVSWTDASGNFWIFGGSGQNFRGEGGSYNNLWKFSPTTTIAGKTGIWTWMGGDSLLSMSGVYGTKGVANAANKPGSRVYTIPWTDAAGNFWLMGGIGFGNNTHGFLNDLWQYNPASGFWTWMGGDTTTSADISYPNPFGVYGTKGIPHVANVPGKRFSGVSWTDHTNNLWLMGGRGFGTGYSGYLNDLWKSNLPITYYRDFDVDGYGDASNSIQSLSPAPPAGYVAKNTDCNDTAANIHPGAPEICDGKDNNCNGVVDEGLIISWFPDNDQDGFGANVLPVKSCIPIQGFVTNNTDCDDNNAAIHALVIYYRDADNDGFGNASLHELFCSLTAPVGYSINSTDCRDDDNTIYPGAPEICDGKDNNCNGQVDEGFNKIFYRDVDGDGYGGSTKITSCTPPAGYTAQGGDCKDNDKTIFPGAPEICDGKDNNCNGQVDEGINKTFYKDVDGDGFGGSTKITTCTPPAGYVSQGGDCKDNDKTIHPGAPEICDGKDNNCNGKVDEGCNTPCEIPTGLNASNITSTSANLSWTEIPGVVNYILRWKPLVDNYWNVSPALSAASYILSGLTPGTAYNFEVVSVCSNGSNSYSGPVTFTTTGRANKANNSKEITTDPKLPAAINKEANLTIVPNPVTSGTAAASYRLANDGKAIIKVIDLNGRILQHADLGYRKAGPYTYNLSNIRNLTNGYYIMVLEQNNKVIARKQFIIVKQ